MCIYPRAGNEICIINATKEARYDGPEPPKEGQLFSDSEGALWKVRKLTVADNPVGFFIVHLMHGASADDLKESLVLGPREWAALMRERDLREHQPDRTLRAA